MHVVLIPAFQPDGRLVALVDALLPRGPVVVVDDGSDAACAPVFAAVAARGAVVIAHPVNRGKGAALRTGFAAIARAWPGADVVTADSDGQHTPDDVARVAGALPGARDAASPAPQDAPTERSAIVLGVRAFTGAVPLRSRAGNALTRRAFRLATGVDVTDTQTGLRGFPAAVLPWLQAVRGDRFEYEFRMLLAAPAAGIAIVQVPIATVYLEANASSHFRPLVDSARIYAPLLRFTASALLAFAVDSAMLLALHAVTGMLLFSVVAARLLSASVNYVVNRSHVFSVGRRLPVRTTLARYASLAGLLLAANYGLLSALSDAGVPLFAAKVLTDAALFVVSYSVQRAVVFAPPPAPRWAAPSGNETPHGVVAEGEEEQWARTTSTSRTIRVAPCATASTSTGAG